MWHKFLNLLVKHIVCFFIHADCISSICVFVVPIPCFFTERHLYHPLYIIWYDVIPVKRNVRALQSCEHHSVRLSIPSVSLFARIVCEAYVSLLNRSRTFLYWTPFKSPLYIIRYDVIPVKRDIWALQPCKHQSICSVIVPSASFFTRSPINNNSLKHMYYVLSM